MTANPHTLYRRLLHFFGKVGIALLIFAAWWELLDLNASTSAWKFVAQLGVMVTGAWLLVRFLRLASRALVWRLRNRLVVTYLFIGLMPLLLVLGLVGLGGYLLAGQLGAYLVTSELDRRVEALEVAARRAMEMPSDAPVEDPNLPALEITRLDVTMGPELHGAVLRNGSLFLVRALRSGANEVRASVPLDSALLGTLIPDLGAVGIRGGELGGRRPVQQGFFDPELDWPAGLAVADWDHPERPSKSYVLAVLTRISAIRMVFFSRSADAFQAGVQVALVALIVAFLIVELICYVIGIGMTRTITYAVHNLYEGTQKVMTGDFSARIAVNGRDQLAELSHSFNEMTANVERLLAVAKEKERLQSEIEIASEVQTQLFPRALPELKSLKITAICRAARLVSGDYYDYTMVKERVVALAIGDVAGKGISAALLMASLQSSLRAHIQDLGDEVSPSELVSRLNRQLYENTSPEKYATFCLGFYDEDSSTFTYTNAGHVPPVLIRGGKASRLDVNGTVVGAFSFALYEQSSLKLEAGDLLVFVTDGVTEPENAYGEMFGEERVVELLAKNDHLTEDKIVALLTEAIGQWTGSPDLQDDLTLLIARRV